MMEKLLMRPVYSDIDHHALVWCYIYFLMPALIVWLPSTAYAVDCTAIKTTNVPYQLGIQKNGVENYPLQIYRGENLTRRQLSIVNNQIFVAYFQANFQLENPGIHNAKITTVYSVPTNKYIWAQGTRVVHGKSMINGKPSAGPGFEAAYAMLPDEVIALGKCSFPVKHYTVRQESPSIIMRSEVWFSPELNTFLRTTISTKIGSTGKTTQIELEARSIDTEFTPFR